MKQSTFHCSKKKVFDAVKKAAILLKFEIVDESLIDGKLYLFSKGGLFSYGNRISVQIKSPNSAKSILKVYADSAAAIQIIDWGTNSGLENDLVTQVKSILI